MQHAIASNRMKRYNPIGPLVLTLTMNQHQQRRYTNPCYYSVQGSELVPRTMTTLHISHLSFTILLMAYYSSTSVNLKTSTKQCEYQPSYHSFTVSHQDPAWCGSRGAGREMLQATE